MTDTETQTVDRVAVRVGEYEHAASLSDADLGQRWVDLRHARDRVLFHGGSDAEEEETALRIQSVEEAIARRWLQRQGHIADYHNGGR